MNPLAKWAGYLAVAAGGLTVALTALIAVAPESPAWAGYSVVALLLALGVLGLEHRTAAATGQLGRWSAWLSVAGLIAVLGVFAWSATSYQEQVETYDFSKDPLYPFWIVSGTAWLLGTIGYAVALIRARVLSAAGAWLVVIGALASVAALAGLGQIVPEYVFDLFFGLFGVGWVLIGYAAVRPERAAA